MIIAGEKYWKVGELARLSGLTIRTLRYYDQIGLFSPSGYSVAGYRLYNESDISRLHQVLALKELDLSLEEIKSILCDDDYNPFEVISIQMKRIKEKIKMQQKLLKELQNVSSLMEKEESSVEDLTKLLGMMKQRHEKYFIERRTSMEHHLEKLGDFLDKHTKNQSKEEE